MYYGIGDNDLEKDIIHDINEMELGLNNGSPNVNVVVHLDKKSEEGSFVFHLQPDTEANDPEREVFQSIPMVGPEPNTGNPETLKDFGRWAIGCFPAENYILIIGVHGRGWSLETEAEGGGTDRSSIITFEHETDLSGLTTYTDERAARLAPPEAPDPFEELWLPKTWMCHRNFKNHNVANSRCQAISLTFVPCCLRSNSLESSPYLSGVRVNLPLSY